MLFIAIREHDLIIKDYEIIFLPIVPKVFSIKSDRWIFLRGDATEAVFKKLHPLKPIHLSYNLLNNDTNFKSVIESYSLTKLLVYTFPVTYSDQFIKTKADLWHVMPEYKSHKLINQTIPGYQLNPSLELLMKQFSMIKKRFDKNTKILIPQFIDNAESNIAASIKNIMTQELQNYNVISPRIIQ